MIKLNYLQVKKVAEYFLDISKAFLIASLGFPAIVNIEDLSFFFRYLSASIVFLYFALGLLQKRRNI